MTDRRSVVLVTIDSLRADACGYVPGAWPGGAGGGDGSLTPALDAMADDGLAFENAVAPGPSTYESLPAVVTGRRMCAYPVPDGDEIDVRTHRIDRNTRRGTVAEWFDDRGYATAAFTTNPYTGAHTNFARGFDRFEDFLDGGEGPLMRRAAHLPVVSEVKHVVTLLRGDRASKPWDAYVDDVRAWVEGVDGPYFLWVFLLDPHTPYLPPAPYRRRGRVETLYRNWRLWAAKKWGFDADPDPDALRGLYAGAVRYADAFLERLRAFLPGDPAVCVHADHGEAFGEHGVWGHEAALYEENVHVPLVVAGGPDRTVDGPVSLTAVPGLLRAAARRELPAHLDALSTDYAMARTFDADRVAVRGPDWKYVARAGARDGATAVGAATDPGGADAPGRSDDADRGTDVRDSGRAESVYDLAADPHERTDRAADRPALADACRALVRRRLAHEREVAAVHEAAGEVDG